MCRFSIVIPVYNVERYLPECLNSVASQTFTDFEVVLVNDGSTDRSLEICRAFAEQSEFPVSVISQENAGLLMARRNGVRQARGEYVISLDSDDALKSSALEEIDVAISSSNCDVVCFDYSRKADYSTVDSATLAKASHLYSGKKEVLKALCSSSLLNNVVTKAVKLSCFDPNDGYVEYAGLNMGEDLLQTISILDNAEKVYYLRSSLYYYRPNQSSITKSFDEKNLDDLVAVRRKLRSFACDWDLSFPGEDYVSYVDGVSMQCCCELAQRASISLDYAEALAFMKKLVESELFRNASSNKGSVRMCRLDYRPVGVALVLGRYRAVFVLSRLKSKLRKIVKQD